MKVVTVNYNINIEGITNTTLVGEETLLDADLVIFDPLNIRDQWKNYIFNNYEEIRTPYSTLWRTSFNKKSNEIELLLTNNKVVIVFIAPVEFIELQKDSDPRSFDTYSNYDFLPIDITFIYHNLTAGKGGGRDTISLIKPNSIFSQYYNAFKHELTYMAYLEEKIDDQHHFLVNKSKRPVGFTLKTQNGLIAFLPYPNYDPRNEKLILNLKSCIKSYQRKPSDPPIWVENYRFTQLEDLDLKIKNTQEKINQLEEDKQNLILEKQKITRYNKLLYESGNELENIVIHAFKLFGFNAQNRKEGDLEHDIVFTSEEGKGIAEIEGKDKDAIKIDKLDQLNRVIYEDLNLTGNLSAGILIGNAYRLTPPDERKDPFSEKVYKALKINSFGLLSTIEIYKAIKYILDNPKDEVFKKMCREKILNVKGEAIKLISENE